jgi:hypothetical protein
MTNRLARKRLRQNVIGRVNEASRPGGEIAHGVTGGEALDGIGRTTGRGAQLAASQIGLDVRQLGRGAGDGLEVEGPFLFGAIDLTEVVDAGIGLAARASAHPVGHRNGRQEANDGNNDHDLHKSEARFTPFCCSHNQIVLFHTVLAAHRGSKLILAGRPKSQGADHYNCCS